MTADLQLVAGHPQAWHDQRQAGLGSSDVAAALGLSTYRRPIDVWRDKRGLTTPREDTPFFEWGRRLEPVVADAAADATGIRWGYWSPAVFCRDWSVAFAHLDRRGRHPDGSMALLECKTGISTKGWADPCAVSIAEAHLVVPAGYAIQVAHELLCTGYPRAYLAALLGYREFRVYEFTTDAGYLDDLLADEQAFWQLVVDGIEPDPDGSDAYRAHLASKARPLEVTDLGPSPEQTLLGAEVLEAKRTADAAAVRYELMRQRMDKAMGNRLSLSGPGWRASRTKGKKTTAWAKAIAELMPHPGPEARAVIARHTKVGDPGFKFEEEEA